MLTKFGEITASKVLEKLDFKDDDLRIFGLKQTDPVQEEKQDIFGDEENSKKMANYKR